ncbi:MAG: HAMP domain-containing sensor histidine kinase [Planctomycetota bacterium]|jgi:signal transduction histidine kinase
MARSTLLKSGKLPPVDLGLSLASKCQILFGIAVMFLVAGAVVIPWLRAGRLVDLAQHDASRRIAVIWPDLASLTVPVDRFASEAQLHDIVEQEPSFIVAYLPLDQIPLWADAEGLAGLAARAAQDDTLDELTRVRRTQGERVYRYAKADRDEQGNLEGIIFVEHHSTHLASQLFIARLYLVLTGVIVGAIAVALFYVITMRLILSPVRQLRETAERIRAGEPDVRADIQTGDEFQELGEAFNEMLIGLDESQEKLRGINVSLDLKVTELEHANQSLHEAARLKGDFLATVSHELRTPLNSIIGFAELLVGIANNEKPDDNDMVHVEPEQFAKRARYLEHIVNAGRRLLEMINELLEMARIEAGKVDLHVEMMSVSSACEGLIALIRPQAERKNITLTLNLPMGVAAHKEAPIIETDPRKFQQIVFNFLSNAVKFTPEGGEVTLRAERLLGEGDDARVRISVLDTGPGIPEHDQQRIFEKFERVESGHVRESAGTGLGLAICKELATFIQGEIQLISEEGQGSMFSLIVPTYLDPFRATEQALHSAGRASSTPILDN